MNDKQRIAELERQLAELNPHHVFNIVIIEGQEYKVVQKNQILRRFRKSGRPDRRFYVVPVIEVVPNE